MSANDITCSNKRHQSCETNRRITYWKLTEHMISN